MSMLRSPNVTNCWSFGGEEGKQKRIMSGRSFRFEVSLDPEESETKFIDWLAKDEDEDEDDDFDEDGDDDDDDDDDGGENDGEKSGAGTNSGGASDESQSALLSEPEVCLLSAHALTFVPLLLASCFTDFWLRRLSASCAHTTDAV